MAEQRDEIARAWAMMEDVKICMLVTMDGDVHRARPMGPTLRPDENAIYFLTDARSPKEEDIAETSNVCLAFADPSAMNFVSVTGDARTLNDRALIRELWTPDAAAFWENADDPRIRAIEVIPQDAQFWDSPTADVVTVELRVAAAAGRAPRNLGENRKIDMN